ncbi:uncharacterized protein LOC144104775 [Amblyomma americanum]
MRLEATNVDVWPQLVGPMEEPTLELLALQPHEPGDDEGATLAPGTLVHIDGDTLVAVVDESQAIAAATEETGPQLAELDLSSLLSAEEPEEDVLQKALLQADTVVTGEAPQEEPEPEPELQPQPDMEAQQQDQQQQQTVVIDMSSPIELCQNALIVVNGQRCVLQQDTATGQVLAYPIREPKRKRGRPRKVALPPSDQEPPIAAMEEEKPEEPPAMEEEDDGDTGMVEVVTEDGALVRRSCRRRKVARTMQDYHWSEGSESEPEPEPEPEEHRRRGRPPKNYHEEDPFWKRNGGRRRARGRKREGGPSSSNPMQAFLVQMADGQTLMMQIPAASIPAGMDLHQVAQNIATSLNAAAAQQALSGGCLPADGGASTPVLIALQGAGSEELQLEQLLPQLQPQPQPQPQPQSQPQPAKRRPGRPRKRPLTPPPTPPPSLPPPTPPAEPVAGGPTDIQVDSMPVLPDGATDNTAEVAMADVPANSGAEAAQNAAAVVAQSLEDAVAQVLGPAATPATEGEDLAPVQPSVEAPAQSSEDTAVVPMPDKLVSLLLPKLGGSAEEQQQLQCPACEFQAGYAQQLQEHLVRVHADAVVRCRRCPHACLSRDALIAHYRAQHPRCVCPYCDHIADQAYAIRRHMARHTQPGACTCPVCGKRYKDPYILKMHLKMVHMPAEVLFECALCGKKFSRKAHLKRHTRTHNPNKPLKCPLCDYRGCERSDITKHMLIHEEPKHVCTVCNRSFRHIKNKELHMKRHKGQKDYKCGVCDFYGYTFTDIRKHIERRHADPHTILCDRCGQAFKTQALLKEHQMSAQCEVYLIEQELTEYEEATPETLLGPTDDPEACEGTLEETLVEADGQLMEASGELVDTSGELVEADGQLVETSEELVEASGHVLEAGSQLLGLPGHQYAILTTSAAGEPTGEVSEVVQDTHIVVQDPGQLLV